MVAYKFWWRSKHALSVQWSGRPPVERKITGSSPVRGARDSFPLSEVKSQPCWVIFKALKGYKHHPTHE